MFTHYRTQGFIIKVINQGETDQLFTIYTKHFGKIEILGKAIRKITSKLRGGAQLFYLSEIEFIQGKTYKTLTDTILINSFLNIRHSLEKIKIAEQILFLLDSLIKGEETDQEIWELLNEILTLLDEWKLKSEKSQLFYYYFFWNFVSFLGYQPELKKLFLTQAERSEAKRGNEMEISLTGKEKINVDLFKILRIILKRDIKTLLKLKLKPFHQKLLKNITQKYFDYIYVGFE
jgi:DNA repair protein RecO (recombination protein O)